MTLIEFLRDRLNEDAEDAPMGVLMSTDAKRRMVDFYADLRESSPADAHPDSWYALRLLAQPYSDHPHFDESWRP